MDAIVQCFTLSKQSRQLDADEISFTAFQRCLAYFAGTIFPTHPGTKYEPLSFESRVDLVLKWCDKLDVQKRKTRTGSDSFRRIKRAKSIKHVRPHRAATVSGVWDNEWTGPSLSRSGSIVTSPGYERFGSLSSSITPRGDSHWPNWSSSYSGGNKSGSRAPGVGSHSVTFDVGARPMAKWTQSQRQLTFIEDEDDL